MVLRVVLVLVLTALSFGNLYARDEAAIQEVKSGKRTEARADWWGFDEGDATAALQAAIDSKAKKLVVPNLGKPWVVRPIKLVSDQEIVFEKGVEIQAKRGEFKSKHHMLITGMGVKNVTLSGEGATLRMWKVDYQTEAYEKSEWRHTLAFYACDNVTVRGLTLADSGGDGIYLGAGSRGAPCKRMTFQGVKCLNHHRQGISVISAEDLLLEDCVFNDTAGTAPQAGIDFEPNSPGEHLKNCVLRRCTFSNNHAAGILFALGKLEYDSEPMSVRFEDCRTTGNATAVHVSVRNPSGVGGSIVFDKCQFEGSSKNGIEIANKAVKGVALTFANCTMNNLASERPDESPIVLKSGGNATETMGGIVFDHCVVNETAKRKPLFYDDVGGARVKEVTGEIEVRRAGEVEQITLNQALLDKWFPWTAELKDYAHFDMKGMPFEPMVAAAHGPYPPIKAWQREVAQFVLWSAGGKDLEFAIAMQAVGRSEIKPSPVRAIAPSGKVSELAPAGGGEPHRYTIASAEAGLYRVVCEAGQHTSVIQSEQNIACLMSLRGAFHFVGRAGPLYFLVPQGVKEFAVRVAGGGGTERVKATIKNAAGTVVGTKDNIGHGEQFAFQRDANAASEVWSVLLERPSQGVLEDQHFMLEGVPPFLAGSPETLLKPRSVK